MNTRRAYHHIFSVIPDLFASNFFLFILCAGIWGSTWAVIKYQLNGPDPLVSIVYRFIISTALMFLFAIQKHKPFQYIPKCHLVFFFQGAFNFSINYIFTYWAEEHAPSALVATAFTLLVAYNILGMKIFYKKPMGTQIYLGALLGIIGVGFIFSNELLQIKTRSSNITGLGLALIATFFASSGNLLSYKNHLNRVPVSVSSAWGMFYGMLVTLILALIQQKKFTFDYPSIYWLTLFYLAIFGTVIAFGAFFTLVGRVGAERAGYTSILSPVIAIILSVIFENMNVTNYMLIGILFCLSGNIITLNAKK